jgi:hypothetical protein
MTSTSEQSNERIWAREIRLSEHIGDRCLRKWIREQRFPQPDGNLNGRNFWHRATYEAWKSDVLAGKYRQQRRPGAVATAA